MCHTPLVRLLTLQDLARNHNHPQLTALQKRDWAAAHILYRNKIRCLAGPPAAAFYGSDSLWIQTMVLVNDPDFEDAYRVLRANGYRDVPIDDGDYRMLQVPDLGPDGKKSVRWRVLAPRGPNGGVTMLAPASHWHFKVADDTTIIVDGIRLPKFSSYIDALVSLIGQRLQSSIPAGYYELQLSDVWISRKGYQTTTTELLPATRFFLEQFIPVKRLCNRRKIAGLWDSLIGGF